LAPHQKPEEEKYKLIRINSFVTVGVNQITNASTDQKWHVKVLSRFVDAKVIFVASMKESLIDILKIRNEYMLKQVFVNGVLKVLQLNS